MILLNVNMDQGIVVMLVGMSVVFLSLLLLHGFFQAVLPRILALGSRVREKAKAKETQPVRTFTSGEEMAAVSAAVYLFLEETHDEENAIVTIHKVSKSYSPWSSKIYVTHRLNAR